MGLGRSSGGVWGVVSGGRILRQDIEPAVSQAWAEWISHPLRRAIGSPIVLSGLWDDR